MLQVDRHAVLDYRVDALGLHRDTDDVTTLAVLDLGVQETSVGSARLALDARLAGPPPLDPTADGRLSLAWSLRGAPHLHRSADMTGLAAALWPSGDDDALARLSWQRRQLAGSGLTGLDAYRVAAGAVRRTVTTTMTKGLVSEAVTRLVPPQLTGWCRGCDTTHITDPLLRLAALPGGAALEFGAAPATLTPLAGFPPPPENAASRAGLITAYLALLGPAGPAEVAAFLGTRQSEVRADWPDGLAEVRVDGRSAWLPADRLDTLARPRPAELVRLLPSFDPFLQARDRLLLLPDKSAHRTLWTVLGNPGAVLVDGEIAGIWRAKASGRRLRITVTLWEALPPPVLPAIEAEAHRVAAVRGMTDVQVRHTA